MSPEQRTALHKLKEQEKSLNRQSAAICSMLDRLSPSPTRDRGRANSINGSDDKSEPHPYQTPKVSISRPPSYDRGNQLTSAVNAINASKPIPIFRDEPPIVPDRSQRDPFTGHALPRRTTSAQEAISASQRQLQRMQLLRDETMQQRLKLKIKAPVQKQSTPMSAPIDSTRSNIADHHRYAGIPHTAYPPPPRLVGSGLSDNLQHDLSDDLASPVDQLQRGRDVAQALKQAILNVSPGATPPQHQPQQSLNYPHLAQYNKHLEPLQQSHDRKHYYYEPAASYAEPLMPPPPPQGTWPPQSTSVKGGGGGRGGGNSFNYTRTTPGLSSPNKRENTGSVPQQGRGLSKIEESQRELQRVRGQREAAIRDRMQRQAKAVALLEQQQLKAVDEARYRAAITTAQNFYKHRQGWLLLKSLHSTVQRRQAEEMARCQWERRKLSAALRVICRHYLHMGCPTEEEVLLFQLRHGWQRFKARFFAGVRCRFRRLEGELTAYNTRLRKYAGRFFGELHRGLQRKRNTVEDLDRRACESACLRVVLRLLDRVWQRQQCAERVLRRRHTVHTVQLRSCLAQWGVFCEHQIRLQRGQRLHRRAALSRSVVALQVRVAKCAELHRAEHFAAVSYLNRFRHAAFVAWRARCIALRAQKSVLRDNLGGNPLTASRKHAYTRNKVRKMLRQWHCRTVVHPRKRLLERYLRGKQAAEVFALLQCWMQHVIALRRKRAKYSATIRKYRRRRGWALFKQRFLIFRDIQHRQQVRRGTTRSLCFSRLMRASMEAYYEYVFRRRRRRISAKQQVQRIHKQQTRAVLRRLIAQVYRGRAARRGHARGFGRIGRYYLQLWRKRARLRLRRRERTARQTLRLLLLRAFCERLSQYREQRRQLRLHYSDGRRAVKRRERQRILRVWLLRRGESAAQRRAVAGAAQARVQQLRRNGLLTWHAFTSRMSSLRWKHYRVVKRPLAVGARIEAGIGYAEGGAVVEVELPSPRWRRGAVRRGTFLQRWIQFVLNAREGHAFTALKLRKMQRHHLRRGFSVFLKGHQHMREENKLILDFREGHLIPLLQRRFFKTIRLIIQEKKETQADPRLNFRAWKLQQEALRWWRTYRREKKLDHEDEALGARNRSIVLCLRYLPQWQFRVGSLIAQATVQLRGDKYYKLRLLLPAMDVWRHNTNAAALQRQAHFHGTHKQMEKFWNKWRQACARYSSGSERARKFRNPTIAARNSTLTYKHWEVLRFYCQRRKALRLKIHTARRKRQLWLLRATFDAIKQDYAETAQLFHQGGTHRMRFVQTHALRSLRLANKASGVRQRAARGRQHLLLRTALMRNLPAFKIKSRADKLLLQRAVRQLRQRELTHQMAQWRYFMAVRRMGGLPAAAAALVRPRFPVTSIASRRIPPRLRRNQQFARYSNAKVLHRILHRVEVRAELRKHILERQHWVSMKVGQLRQHQALHEWLLWQTAVIHARAAHEHAHTWRYRRHSGELLPAFRRYAAAQHMLRVGARHAARQLLWCGWKSWSAFAYVGWRRALARAKKAAATAAAVAGASSLTAAATAGHAAPLLLPGEESDEDEHHYPHHHRNRHSNFNIHVRDFRVTTQHQQWSQGHSHYQHHLLREAFRSLFHTALEQQHRQHAVQLVTLKRLSLRLHRWGTHSYLRIMSREQLRRAGTVRADFLKRLALKRLRWFQHLSRAHRRTQRMELRRFTIIWEQLYIQRTKAKRLLQLWTKGDSFRALHRAFHEWRCDTYVESVATQRYALLCRRRLQDKVGVLRRRVRVHRRAHTLLVRARTFQTDRWLRRVFASLLLDMSIHYRSVEVLAECDKHHRKFTMRYVLHNIYHLRRNRIAKDHNLRCKFLEFIEALRCNWAVVQHDKTQMVVGNTCILHKRFLHWRAQAKKNAGQTRKMRRWLNDSTASISPAKTAIASLATPGGAGTVARERVDRTVVVDAWNGTFKLQQYLQDWHCTARAIKSSKKVLVKSDRHYQARLVYCYFRALLSHARVRQRKRRSAASLQGYLWRLRMHRGFSKLDINVSARWARVQQRRVLAEYSVRQGMLCGLAALRVDQEAKKEQRRLQARRNSSTAGGGAAGAGGGYGLGDSSQQGAGAVAGGFARCSTAVGVDEAKAE